LRLYLKHAKKLAANAKIELQGPELNIETQTT
jgi:hypothetical protein